MAGTKSTLTGKDFYGPYDAQEVARKYAKVRTPPHERLAAGQAG